MPGTVREADLTGSLFRIDTYIYQSPSVPEYNIPRQTSVGQLLQLLFRKHLRIAGDVLRLLRSQPSLHSISMLPGKYCPSWDSVRKIQYHRLYSADRPVHHLHPDPIVSGHIPLPALLWAKWSSKIPHPQDS